MLAVKSKRGFLPPKTLSWSNFFVHHSNRNVSSYQRFKMLKIHFLTCLFFYHILSVFTRKSTQYCGKKYFVKAQYVKCTNPGNVTYECGLNTCYTDQGSIEKTLFFRDCRVKRNGTLVKYVWPDYFEADAVAKNLTVRLGETSNEYSGLRVFIDSDIGCTWHSGYDQNNVRPRCKGCKLIKDGD
ncbi:hypothetical protein O181_011165 [Austropuccinia psidii MF-1]|uniref:Uncharacterized protein n=1 Tax=Austropuccinia psidii MF-1 TaxID=1389203 RepID=A0A9Q3BVD6_9BASI|nr:hypothetical protein [Austropuccinia psidii MF-1]